MAMVRKEADAFEVPPAGTQPAVVVAVIDLGTHGRERDETQGGKKTGKKVLVPTTEVFIGFELAERKSDGTPFVVGREYTLSLNEKSNLHKVCKALLGRVPEPGEDYINLQEAFGGKQATVNVEHKAGKSKDGQPRTYPKLESVSPPMKGVPPVKPASPLVYWELGDPTFEGMFDHLPRIYGRKIEDEIASCQEMLEAQAGEGAEETEDAAAL